MRHNALCSGCHSSHNSCTCRNHNSHQHHHKTSTSHIRYVGPKLLCTNVINCDDLTTIIEKTDFTICDIYNVLETKVDKIPGKGLSKNDFTDLLKTKLDGVQEGAEANVNPDWAATSGDAQILNKPNTIGGYGIIDAYTKAQVDSGQLDGRYFTKIELDPLANPGDNSLDFRYYTKLQLDLGELDDRYYTESELNNGQLDNRYYTETELNSGQLNNLYYTEAELNAGQLDNRYYTQAQINAAIGTAVPTGTSITINGVTQDLSADRTWTIDLSPYQLRSEKGQPNGYAGIDGSGNLVGDIFGSTAGKAVEGNDPRLLNGQTSFDWGNHANAGYQLLSEKGQPGGYTPLGTDLKISTTYLPDSILGQVKYNGLWDPNSNEPTLDNPPTLTTKGDYYIATTNGTFAGIDFNTGDWIISDGSTWGKVDNTDAVTSVFGRNGNIYAIEEDYAAFYAPLSHTHTIAEVNNLQSTLDAITSSRWGLDGTSIFYNGGNVGIGTSSPSFALDILRAENSAQRIQINNTSLGINASSEILALGNDNRYSGILSFGQNQTGTYINGVNRSSLSLFESGGDSSAMLINAAGLNQPIIFATGNTQRMRITASGNVLIGTTTSGNSKLKIAGLPTSPAGLTIGDVWINGCTLEIVTGNNCTPQTTTSTTTANTIECGRYGLANEGQSGTFATFQYVEFPTNVAVTTTVPFGSPVVYVQAFQSSGVTLISGTGTVSGPTACI